MSEQVRTLAEARKVAGLTQQQLADCLEIDRTTVSKWEISKATPKIKMLPDLSAVLRIPLGEVIAIVSQNEEAEETVTPPTETEKIVPKTAKQIKVKIAVDTTEAKQQVQELIDMLEYVKQLTKEVALKS